MIYKIHLTDGQRLTMDADSIEQNGSGTRLLNKAGGLVAAFYCGEVARVFPEGTLDEAEVTPKKK